MKKNVLLVGLRPDVVEDTRSRTTEQGITIFRRTSLADAQTVLKENPIIAVIVGAGLDLDLRIEIVQHICEASESTSVHMKDRASGPQGFLPFVNSVLIGLTQTTSIQKSFS